MSTDPRDRGSTLVEAMLTTLLVVLVLGLAATMLIAGQRSSSQTVGRLDATNAARLTVETMTRTVRSAIPSGVESLVTLRPSRRMAVEAGAERLVFYAHDNTTGSLPYNGGPTKTTYRLDATAGTLVEERVPAGAWDPASGTYDYSAVPVSRVLARNVSVPQPQPLFTYYAEMSPTCPTATSCPIALVGVGPAAAIDDGTDANDANDLDDIRAVGLSLSIDTPEVRTGAATVSAEHLVHLPNKEAVIP